MAVRRCPTSRFLRLPRLTRATPVWFMRQAGRSLPEYRAIRGTESILEAISHPELAAEITMQPVRRYGVDAAILFSDIVVPHAAIGVGIEIVAGRGPVLDEPFRSSADLARLRDLEPETDTPYVLDTVKILRSELEVPLIGFAGAPFTVGSYFIEGGPTRTFAKTKSLMHNDPALFMELMDRLADLAIASLKSQIDAGVSAIQLFDSWAGALSRADYERFVLPATRKVLAGVADLGVPRIHFGVGTGELLDLMAVGAEVVGVDWRVPLDVAAARAGRATSLQGNLDPPSASLASTPSPTRRDGSLPKEVGRRAHLQPRPRRPARDRPRRARPPRRVRPRIEGSRQQTMTTAVLVMSYGTPRRSEDVEAYYTDIRRGHPPTKAEQLDELISRYEAIGGVSPMNDRTAAQIAALQTALDASSPGTFRTYYGTKHATPKIEDGRRPQAALDGCDAIVGLVLAPHFSKMSVGEYIERAAETAKAVGVRASFLKHWHDEPALIDALATRVADALGDARPRRRSGRPSSSPRTASPRGCSRTATRTPTRSPRPLSSSRTAGDSPLPDGLAERRAGPPSRGSAQTSATSSTSEQEMAPQQ